LQTHYTQIKTTHEANPSHRPINARIFGNENASQTLPHRGNLLLPVCLLAKYTFKPEKYTFNVAYYAFNAVLHVFNVALHAFNVVLHVYFPDFG
jgi:hypothetical protein